jgi:DNA-binding NarL/FixJ family response regulator
MATKNAPQNSTAHSAQPEANGNGIAPGPRPLTRREKQIATLASKGVPNGKIAKKLGLSIRTVESHLYRVYGKLGVSARDKLPPLIGLAIILNDLT